MLFIVEAGELIKIRYNFQRALWSSGSISSKPLLTGLNLLKLLALLRVYYDVTWLVTTNYNWVRERPTDAPLTEAPNPVGVLSLEINKWTENNSIQKKVKVFNLGQEQNNQAELPPSYIHTCPNVMSWQVDGIWAWAYELVFVMFCQNLEHFVCFLCYITYA